MSKQMLLCAFLLLLFSGLANGQTTTTSSITGIVTDPKGAVVSGGRVTARNTATGLVQSRVTNNRGAYTMVGLAPGPYEVTCEAARFARAVVPSLRLSVGQVARVDFSLPIGQTKYSVTVSGTAPTLGSQTTDSQVLYQSELNQLPVFTRNFVQLTLLTPKVLPASPVTNRGYMGDRYKENQFSFQGVPHGYNYETIDGANATVFITNAPRSFYSLESVQEFRVTNSLWTAEQGHAMGGLINVITRSGGNTWHGSAYDYFRNDALNEPDLLAVPGHNVLRRNQFGASGGGPIRKEKLYVFGNYEGQRQANSPQLPPVFVQNLATLNTALAALGFPPETDRAVQTSDYDQFLIRTDVLPHPKHRLILRYNFFNGTNLNALIGNHGQLGDPITPEGSRDQHLRDQGAVANLISSLSANWTNDGGFGFSKHNYQFARHPGVPPITLAVQGAFQTGADYSELATGERTFHARDAVTWTHGAHVLKFGGEYLRSDASQTNGPLSFATFAGLPGLAANPPLITSTNLTFGTLPAGYIFHSNWIGAFAQDQWKANRRFTLNLGLRYDLERLSGMTTIVDSGRGNLQPRIGFAWSPTDKPLVIRGGFGTYTAVRSHPLMFIDALLHGVSFPSFNQAFLDANPFAARYQPLPNLTQRLTYVGPAALPALEQFVATGTAPAALPSLGNIGTQDPNLPNPYARQWGLEVEYQVRPDLTIVAGYSGLQALRLPVAINRNLRPATTTLPSGLPNYQASGPSGAPYRYDPSYGTIYIFQAQGSSLYNAGTLTVRKRFGQNYSFSANYTFSKNLDNTGGAAAANSPEDPYNIDREWSVSSDYAKHRLVLWFDAQAPANAPLVRGFGASAILTAQSPHYYNVTVGKDVNNDLNVFTDRPDALGRNTFRGDNFVTLDLRVVRRFRPKERLSIEATADFFNLLNRVNVTDINTVYGQPTLALPPFASFGNPIAVGTAFQTQLGLRVSF